VEISEASEVVGKALKRNGKRESILLATKVHERMDDEDPNAAGNHRRHIIEQCDASLKGQEQRAGRRSFGGAWPTG
jgi:aryl-alcohol dehydrogenase-like predicted oxidoreductase